MNRRQALKACGLAAAAPLLSFAAPTRRQPNILFILADDLGWRDTSFTGSEYYETANIERLARRGVYFPNAYAANPLCSPTRASILTGLHPARIGLTAPECHRPPVRLKASVAESAGPTVKTLKCQSVTRLDLEYRTLAETMKDAGYATGHFGKWHLGPEPYDPLNQGFDVDIPHWPGPGPAGSYVAPWKFPTFKERVPNEHIEDRMGDEAVAFMEARKDKPFLLNYWQFSVHAPFDAKADYIEEYRGKLIDDYPQQSPTYAAMVRSLDDNVGKMLDALDRLEIADNTIIVFFSDNGGNMYNVVDDGVPPTNNAPLRGGKATIYEGGVRVPCIVVWPGVTKANTTNNDLIHSTDFYPTLLEMTGVDARQGQRFDGVSLAGTLRGRPLERDAVFCYFPHSPPVPDHVPPSVCVRRGDWKLIRIFHDSDDVDDDGVRQHRYELYNLADDIGEQNDQSAKRPDLVKELDCLVENFLQETNAVTPQPNPDYAPDTTESIGGWQPGANGHAKASIKDGALHIETLDADPQIKTVEVKAPAGSYVFRARMRCECDSDKPAKLFHGGAGQAFSPKRSVALKVTHDGKWRDYRVEFKGVGTTKALRFDPCAGKGWADIDWLRLETLEGKSIREWAFTK